MSNISITSFFCEDLRKEADGRCSAIGIYSALGQMDTFPHRVERLRLVVYISSPKSVGQFSVTAKLRHKGVTLDGEFKESIVDEFVRTEDVAQHPYWQVINEYDLGAVEFERDGYLEIIVQSGTSKSTSRLHYIEFDEDVVEED